MGKVLKDEHVHHRRVKVHFSSSEVRDLLLVEAMRIAGGEPGHTTITISQEEEGSPRYKVDRWNATVEIVQELGG